jgi:hypothetical protein
MNFYLSGASAELALCESYRDRLLWAGHKITLDWMARTRANSTADARLSVREQARIAQGDLWAADNAGIFWLLLPGAGVHTIGAWVEFGYVLGLEDAPIVIVSGPWNSIFDQLGQRRFETHEEAFAHIREFY